MHDAAIKLVHQAAAALPIGGFAAGWIVSVPITKDPWGFYRLV
jgi:hypothetical protein